jgi:arachidonate 15-lipoxygenase
MSFWQQEAIIILYRFITFIAKVPFAKRLLISNSYEYNYTYIDRVPMTDVPSRTIGNLNLPNLPKEDELPDEKWVALVLGVLGVLNQKTKSNTVNESVSNENEIDLLESINEEIKATDEQEDLTNAVLKLKSALGLGDTQRQVPIKTKNDIQLESNGSPLEDEFDKIDREIEDWLSQNIQQESPTSLNLEESATFLKAKADEKADKELYGHFQEISKFLGRELIDNQPDFKEVLESTSANPSLEDYEKLIDPLIIKPATLTGFQQDKVFAYMQVAGPNPVMLNQIKTIDSRLPITNEQYQNILPQDSLEAALQEGRLYLADYSKLGDLTNGSAGGFKKFMYAPLALFAVPPDKNVDKNLLPIAIRCQQTPGDEDPIFTPLDNDNWMTAKTILQMADSNYHELISHLVQTHLFIEPFVLATNRCFTKQNHPVKLLLKPHFEGTILVNYGAHELLLAEEGSLDYLLGATIESNVELAIEETLSQLANFNEVAFPRTLEKRGVNNSKQLPIYPYRDDGLLIWGAIHQWVKDYLGLFYSSDKSVETDAQLQNWAGELLSKGKCKIGEEGNGRIKTRDYLVEAISTVIFTASAQHAAVNFSQSGLMTYAPAFPLGCYSPAPTKTQQQQDFMGLLPPLQRAELQIRVLYLLGSVYYTKLGDYSNSLLKNEKVKIPFYKFKVNLNEIEAKILAEDSQRLVSYRYLLPSKIPQSINI